MAGNWLKLEASTPDKPEVLAITVAMGWDDPDLVVGKLFRAWRWFDEHTIEGNAPRVTAALLDRIIGVTGFAAAMADVGWLVINDGGLSLPNFDRHNGKTAKDRALTAKRVANHKTNAKTNADTVTDALPREEKNREEVKTTTALPPAHVASDADNPPAEPEAKDAIPCPVQKIVEAYHALMPDNPKVRLLDDARRRTIAARWRQAARANVKPFGYATADDGVQAWKTFFEVCSESDFLTGRAPPGHGRDKPFVADLDFLLSPKGFKGCLENKYHRGVE